MRADKFALLKRCLAEKRWNVNVESGEVSTFRGDRHSKGGDGYYQIMTKVDGQNVLFKVHQIIAAAAGFDLADKDGEIMTIDHINQNKSDNRISNLEIVSARENTMRAMITGNNGRRTKARGSRHGRTKLDETDVAYIKKSNRGVMELADMFKVAHSRISDIRSGKTWLDVAE